MSSMALHNLRLPYKVCDRNAYMLSTACVKQSFKSCIHNGVLQNCNSTIKQGIRIHLPCLIELMRDGKHKLNKPEIQQAERPKNIKFHYNSLHE